ncbi:MAG: DUF4124 domain-containing protein [Gammaproteobacteria bacterium]|nr:DUF4124 domain-containing protein [Gammaproteobacteria bacterium]
MKKTTQISLLLRHLIGTLTLALILASPAIGSGIYKWTDDNGKVHYGSQRPQDASAERMKLQVSEPYSQENAEDEKPEEKQEKEVKLKDNGDPEAANEERTAYCANERKRLQTVEKNKTIHEKDSTGKVIKLAAKERSQRLDSIKANISKYCK